MCVQKKLSAVAKNLFFVEVIWLGGVSSISGTPNGVYREPFPTSYNIYSIAYYARYIHICKKNHKKFLPAKNSSILSTKHQEGEKR